MHGKLFCGVNIMMVIHIDRDKRFDGMVRRHGGDNDKVLCGLGCQT